MFCPYCGIDDTEHLRDVYVVVRDWEDYDGEHEEHEDLSFYKCRHCYKEFLL